MKRFAFRLERVLRVRETVLSMRRVELATAQVRLADEERKMGAVEEALRQSEDRFRGAAVGRAAPWLLATTAGYLRYLEDERRKQRVEVEKAEDQVEISRQRLVEARQETRVLEKLREKRMALHVGEVIKEEQATLDEIGAIRHAATRQAAAGSVEGGDMA